MINSTSLAERVRVVRKLKFKFAQNFKERLQKEKNEIHFLLYVF